VKPGELVLGYANEYGLYPTSPRVPASSDPHGVLAPDPSNGSHHDLGRNGSYLVLRQLEQDVRAFWRFADDAARSEDGRNDPVSRVRIAAKLVGRWPSGAPLVLAPDADDPALAQENTFRYHAQDAGGHRCPVGAHIRRANPRDSLDPNPGSDGSVAVAKHHRLLRRGREYGSRLTMDQALEPAEAGDDGPRGLHFICLNSNVARQFEFIHQTWVNSPKFADLYDEPDPIVTGGGFFSIPAEPVRHRLTNMPRFLRVRGGAYFLLPGLRAIRYVSGLES
jgi:Dyp-type peroxidase family